ncbi:MAG TPA: FecR domain-containing protein, partial [Terriglobales bacterium]|nr:FecR domain-containing protein [Terriglobales bacterium]
MPALLFPLLALFAPAAAWGQAPTAPKAGVVTTLEGSVTATRAAATQPLRFKDDVFQRDKITTGEQSLARMLLGGKAVVTVRERSVLTITELPDRSTIDIESGKFALAVARERMRPGEVIEIRTPNAIAGVRGSVVVTEVESTGGAAPVASSLYVITGTMEAQPFNRAAGTPVGAPQTVNGLQQFRVVGLTGAISPIRPDQLGPIRAGLQPRSKPHTQAQNQDQLSAQAMQTAIGLAGALAPGQLPSGTLGVTATPPLPTPADVTNAVLISLKEETQLSLSSGTAVAGAGSALSSVLTNPGFETGDFTGWTLSGAGSVLSSFGSLRPIEGRFFGLIHTRTGSTLSGCGAGNDCTRSTLSQSFNVNSVVSVSARGFLLSNEFPTFTSSNSAFNDRYLLQLIDASGQTFTLFDQRVNQTSFSAFGTSASAGAFSLGSSGGVASFDLGKKTVVTASGTATLRASVSNVSDTALDSAFILDAVAVTQDPPRHFVTGGTLTSNGALFSSGAGAQTFDSLLLVCCDGSATLNGAALHATDSDLTLPFSVVTVVQGGRLTSTWPGAMLRLEGGRYRLGEIVSVFDIAGRGEDDEPFRHPGAFLDATGASIAAGNVLRVDAALLQASAPLLRLHGSTLVTNDSAVDLSNRARLASVGPLFSLSASTLAVNGALVNVRNGSTLSVRGFDLDRRRVLIDGGEVEYDYLV